MAKPKKYQYPDDPTRAVYHRWASINRRCSDPRCHDYPLYGALGLSVEWVWHRDNPDGYPNFANWLGEQLKIQTDPLRRNVTLLPGKITYSPEHCTLATRQELVQGGAQARLTTDTVLALRALKRAQPHLRLIDLIEQLGLNISLPVASNALRGITFKNLDELEAPYTQQAEEVS